jgi:hypothetical protein
MTAPTTTPKKANRTVPAEYGMCRTWQHAWDYTTVKRKGRDLVQGLACIRCGTMKTVKIDSRTGERLANYYDYPDNYTLKEGGSMTQRERAALRLSEVKRHLR